MEDTTFAQFLSVQNLCGKYMGMFLFPIHALPYMQEADWKLQITKFLIYLILLILKSRSMDFPWSAQDKDKVNHYMYNLRISVMSSLPSAIIALGG